MKLFNKKEEKNKVGRPKLADKETKKKALITICVALAIVVSLLLTGAFKLNIINLGKLKGSVNMNLCSEIPARFQPYNAETNPEGLHEYGFTNPKFYSAVLSGNYNNKTFCSTITEEQLSEIRSLFINGVYLDNVDGVEYLTGLTSLSLIRVNNLYKPSFDSINLSNNTALIKLDLTGNLLKSIDLSKNTALTELDLTNNKLSYIDLSKNTALTELDLIGNKLSYIDLSKNTALTKLDLTSNKLSYIDVSKNTALTELDLTSNKLSYIDVSKNTVLTKLKIEKNEFNKIYSIYNKSLTIEPNIIIPNSNDITYTINDPSYATYKDGIVEKVKNGIVDLLMYYKKLNITIVYHINFAGVICKSDGCIINEEEKTIDLNKNILYKNRPYYYNYVNSYDVNSNDYSLNMNNDKLEVQDNSGKIIDTYKYVNYVLYKLESNRYNINNTEKTVDLNNERLDKFDISYIRINPYDYIINLNNNKIEVKDSSGKIVDTYTLINYKEKDEEAYIKAGFKDKELYDAVLKSYFRIEPSEELPGRYLLTDEELSKIAEVISINGNISDLTGLEKLTNLYSLTITKNKLSGTLDFSDYERLEYLDISKNKLSGTLDLRNCEQLYYLDISNNEIEGIKLPNTLSTLIAYNNNIKSIDFSENYIYGILLQNTPITNIYALKDKTINYKEILKLNDEYEYAYEITDNEIIKYEDGIIKALKIGSSFINISNNEIQSMKPSYHEKMMYCSMLEHRTEECQNVGSDEFIKEAMEPNFISTKITVYNVTSDIYDVDNDKKIIDVKNQVLDESKIKVEGLEGKVENNKLIIKDGDKEVEKYSIKNVKKVVNHVTTTSKTEKKEPSSTKTNKKETKKTSKTIENQGSKTENEEDIKINGSKIPLLALNTIKGKDRNIIATTGDVTITIKGKDIKKVEGDLDLSINIEKLKESIIYNDVKDKVQDGIVLSINGNKELPEKVLISLNMTDEIKNNAGTNNLNIYNHNNKKLILIAKDVNSKDNKLSFYLDKLGSYILTDKTLDKKSIKEEKKLVENNNKINKGISFKFILWLSIILIVLGITGYTIYKKNKYKNN